MVFLDATRIGLLWQGKSNPIADPCLMPLFTEHVGSLAGSRAGIGKPHTWRTHIGQGRQIARESCEENWEKKHSGLMAGLIDTIYIAFIELIQVFAINWK